MHPKVSYNRLGDVFRNGSRDLTDAILGLKIVTDLLTDKPLCQASDVNSDSKKDVAESTFDPGVASGQIPNSTS